MLEPINQWRVHIGLHRTATTNLQDTLELVRDQLIKKGVDYPTRAMLRNNRIVDLYFIRQRGLARLMPGFYRRHRLIKEINQIRSGPTTLLFSEEQWVGRVRDILAQPSYPDLEKRIAELVRCTGKKNLTLFLSLREYSDIFSSAYSQSLRMGNQFEKDFFARASKNALVQPPDWVDLVRRIKRVAPNIPLRIWTFEDYIQNCQPILEAYSGVTLPSWPKLAAPESTRGASVETIQKILSIDKKLKKAVRRALCYQYVAEDQRVTKFDPFTPDEKRLLRAKYAEDLLTIERENPGAFIR